MQLRNHPLVSYRGHHSWPPVWVCRVGRWREKTPTGEVGVLKRVLYEPDNKGKIFLVIDYHHAEYVGCMLFDSAEFCEELAGQLRLHHGASIETLGSLDVTAVANETLPRQVGETVA